MWAKYKILQYLYKNSISYKIRKQIIAELVFNQFTKIDAIFNY